MKYTIVFNTYLTGMPQILQQEFNSAEQAAVTAKILEKGCGHTHVQVCEVRLAHAVLYARQ